MKKFTNNKTNADIGRVIKFILENESPYCLSLDDNYETLESYLTRYSEYVGAKLTTLCELWKNSKKLSKQHFL